MNTFGLIGFPLGHSLSQKIFSEKFSREAIRAQYLNFEIENIAQLNEIILNNPRLKGLNVTIPYKEKVIPLLHALSPEARKIGAVNTVRIERENNDARLIGYNTDSIGFKNSIEPLIRPALHKKALILGTGGASKAVAYALTQLGIQWKYVSRTPADGRFTYDEVMPETLSEYTVIVNASPVGTSPHTDRCPDIPYEAITHRHLLYDLVYNPHETLFLKKGKAKGAATENGAEMLRLQAEEAWKIWNEECKR